MVIEAGIKLTSGVKLYQSNLVSSKSAKETIIGSFIVAVAMDTRYFFIFLSISYTVAIVEGKI